MLDINNLRVSYGSDEVLTGVDLHVSAGQSLAIIGESGAGKTTLGLSIMGLAEGVVRGSASLDGRELVGLPEDEMRAIRWRRVAMVFQNVNDVLNPVVNILSQVAEPITAHGLMTGTEATSKAEELLRYFGLPEVRFSAYPHELSGGEQQRVLLAMAYADNPDLIVLDEPLSSLDVMTRGELCALLGNVDPARARLVITHDLDTAGRLSDRLAVLYGGRIVETGPTDEVLRRPRHPYTRALVRAYPNMTTTKDLQGIKGRLTRPVSGCPFHPRCTQAIDMCGRAIPGLTGDGERQVACHRGGIVTLLSTQNLSKSFGPLKAVDSVSLRVDSGESLALVGQSGSGKTTFARTIMGLCSASGGSVCVEGKRVVVWDNSFYGRIQMVFQNPGSSLSHRLSVLEAVMEPLEVQGWGDQEKRKAKAIRTIEEVELPTNERFLNRYPHHLSGGEMQRVVIARALVVDPDLLLADEPTAFLDASLGAKILKLLLNLQESRGLSMLYITHDIAAARKVADRMAVMLEGRIVEEGPSSDVIANPRHEYTRRLISSAQLLPSTPG